MFDISTSVSLLFVLMEGVISFFSPCILPLLPLYFSYLGGNAKSIQDDGRITYHRGKVLIYTISFLLGVSCAFFLMGLSVYAFGQFFEAQKYLLIRLGGVIIIILGFIQIGLFRFSFFQREWRLPFSVHKDKINLIGAFVLGFTFSFAWTPCVGPALSSVLIMAGSADTSLLGVLYIAVYTIGFILPFLCIALFTTSLLNLIKKYQHILQLFIKIGGVILVIIGFMMFMGAFHENQSEVEKNAAQISQEKSDAIDFTLYDLEGKEVRLSDYKGKVIYLNFWATWCPPCKEELPSLIETYEKYGSNQEDVVFISVVMPGGKEQDKEGIQNFVDENKIEYPVLLDEGYVFSSYSISSLPTTYLINKDFKIQGAIKGALTNTYMESIIEQTLTAE